MEVISWGYSAFLSEVGANHLKTARGKIWPKLNEKNYQVRNKINTQRTKLVEWSDGEQPAGESGLQTEPELLHRTKKARQLKSKVKIMLIPFFQMRVIVHSERSCHWARRSISKEILRCNFRSVRERDESCGRTNRGCFTATMQLFLVGRNITELEQHPNPTDLVPCDFFLFRNSKGSSRGRVLKAWRLSRGP